VSPESHAWDLFISHASEDKEPLVRPLATELSRLGLRVWYDEFSLRAGDSLSASIDRGLAESEVGLVVISPSFMAKPWPRKELAGLVAGQVGRDQLILPIWFNVSRDEVLAFSPTLADMVALVAVDSSLSDLALRILERVKPELHSAILRRLAFLLRVSKAKPAITAVSDLKLGPIRHERLPFVMANRLRIIREVLLDVLPMAWLTTVDSFQRELYPEDELRAWEALTGVYITVVNEFQLSHADRKQLFTKLSGKMLRMSDEPWRVSDESPQWQRRAHELSSGDIDPLSKDFGSR
jgi:hypothetical protein